MKNYLLSLIAVLVGPFALFGFYTFTHTRACDVPPRAALTVEQLGVRIDAGKTELKRLQTVIGSDQYEAGNYDRLIALRDQVIADSRELELRRRARRDSSAIGKPSGTNGSARKRKNSRE